MTDRTPSLREVEAALKRAGNLSSTLVEAFRWAASMGYGGGGSGEAKRYSLGDVSDPTAGAVESKARSIQRKEYRTATTLALDAVVRLTGAQAALERLAKAAEVRNPEESEVGPRVITKAELAEAEAAKRKRENRREGWGAA